MIKILRVEPTKNGTWVHMRMDKDPHIHWCLGNGLLEAYQGAFHLDDPADAILMLIVDALVEDADSFVPHLDDPDGQAKVRTLIDKHRTKLDWNGLKDEIVNYASLREDLVEPFKQLWFDQATHFQENPHAKEGPFELALKVVEAQGKAGEGFQRVQEERLADEFIAAQPELKAIPRITDQPRIDQGFEFRFI